MSLLGFASAAIDQGVFKESGGTLGALALSGDPAPGTTETFTAFNTPVLNGVSAVAFLGRFGAAPFDMGLFTDSGGTLTAAALLGDAAPGTTDAFLFFNFAFPVLNEAGDLAFTVVLGPPGARCPIRRKVPACSCSTRRRRCSKRYWRPATCSRWRLGCARGPRGAPSWPLGHHDGRGSGFNDRGQAALRVVFADGSQAIVRATPADTALDDLITAVEAANLPGRR